MTAIIISMKVNLLLECIKIYFLLLTIKVLIAGMELDCGLEFDFSYAKVKSIKTA